GLLKRTIAGLFRGRCAVMNPRRSLCLWAVLLVAFVPLALAQGTYTQIDVPGAIHTYCYGINARGDLSGSYSDVSGGWHGFLLSSGSFTTFDFPGASVTYVYGINDKGHVVGYAANGTRSTGFGYDP